MEKVHKRTRTKTPGKAALGIEEKLRRRERLEASRGIVRAKLRGEWATATANLSDRAKTATKGDNQDANDITG